MSTPDFSRENLYTYAMDLFSRAGHVATSEPEFINHSPEQFSYFDNKSDVAFTREQRGLFKDFNNISRLFSVNRCVFFSIDLLSSRVKRSQMAHDIHTMIHPVVEAEGTVCLFRNDDEVLLSFLGFGLQCILSDWYPMVDDNETLLEKVDIVNISINRNADYFLDMVYMVARPYYLYEQPPTYALFPLSFKNGTSLDELDREEINQFVQDQLDAPMRDYGDDYVDYDDSMHTRRIDIGAELNLMLLEMDDEEENPFREEIELEENDFDEDKFFDGESGFEEKDEYEFYDVDPEIFRDPSLMVKWLKKEEQD